MELSAHLDGVQIAPALIAGNTIVIKPAPTTPLSTLRIGALIKDIVPAGVVNFITDENDLGAALTAHPDVEKFRSLARRQRALRLWPVRLAYLSGSRWSSAAMMPASF